MKGDWDWWRKRFGEHRGFPCGNQANGESIQAALIASMLELSDWLQPILHCDSPPFPGVLLCQITEGINPVPAT